MSRSWGGRLAALTITVLAGAGLVIGSAGVAQAHAELGGSSPAQGERLETSPRSVLLELTEPVVLDRTVVTVADADGRRVSTGAITVLPRNPLALQGAVAVGVALPALPRGSYFVSWRTVSRDDMHQTYGTLAFGVGADVDPAAARTERPPTWRVPGETLLRWGVFLGLALLVGSTALDRSTAGRSPLPDPASAALRRVAPLGGALAVLCGLALELLLLGSAPAAVWQSRFGQVWTGYLAAVLLATGLARRNARRPSTGAAAGTLAAAGGGYLLAALVGHPAAAGGGLGALTLVTATHLTATALWSGGVLALALAARPAGRTGSTRDLARSFALLAAPALLLSVLSGLWLAGVLVPSVAGLTGSGYGRAVAAKAALTALAAVLGLATARSARRHRPDRPAGRAWLPVEAAVLLAALGVAGLLGSLGPPTAPRFAATPDWSADQSARSLQVDDLLVSVSATPNRPGPNFVLVEVHSTRRPEVSPVRAVQVRLADGDLVDAVRQPDGSWLGPTQTLRSPGPVRISVRVLRPDLPDAVTGTEWVVAPTAGSYAGGRRLTDYTRWALTATPLLVLGAGVVLATRRRRSPRTRPVRDDRRPPTRLPDAELATTGGGRRV